VNNQLPTAAKIFARACLRAERGIALVMSLGVLFTLSVAGTATYVYTSGNARSSELSKDSELAFSLAEAGIAEALSILNNALDPMTASTLSPERTLVLEGGQAKYSGVLSGQTWTVTSRGIVANPTGAGGELTRTLTRKAQVYGVNGGATVSAWSRFYHDNASVCLEIEDVEIPTSISARGDICMKGTAKITGSESRVEAGGDVIMTAGSSTNLTRSAGAGAGWMNAGNIGASDNFKATSTVSSGGQSANLDASSFGFAIPADATIAGIRVSVERGASASGYIGDVDAYLLKGGSTGGITDHATCCDWNSGDAIRTYGSSSDLWGTTWTPADVNASNFGFRLKVDNDAGSSVTANVDHVQITVYYLPAPATSIGLFDSPVLGAYIAGTCTYGSQPAHAPCSSVDKVYASTITQTPETLAKPTIDLAYWYSNAKPGPMHNCTVGSFPGGFDNDTTYNKSRPGSPEITPEGTSYTCQVNDAEGALIGELSWNHLTRVLKIKGTIFVDGDLRFDDDGTIVHYQGRGIIYAADDIEYDEIVCAGGSGMTNCITEGMDDWDPTQNMLIVLSGEDSEFDQGATQSQSEPSGLQGIIYAKGECTIHQNFHLSGPVICDTIYLPDDGYGWPTYYTWPPLGSLVDGQIYADPETAGDFLVRPLEQSG
jgi:Tfp pilus assembly protein PilX